MLAGTPPALARARPAAPARLLRLLCDAALAPRPPAAEALSRLAGSLGPAALRLLRPGLVSWESSRLGQALG